MLLTIVPYPHILISAVLTVRTISFKHCPHIRLLPSVVVDQPPFCPTATFSFKSLLDIGVPAPLHHVLRLLRCHLAIPVFERPRVVLFVLR